MGNRHKTLDLAKVAPELAAPQLVDHVHSRRVLHQGARLRAGEINLEDVTVKGAWSGPAGLELRDHALTNLTDLPVREVLSATDIQSDLTVG